MDLVERIARIYAKCDGVNPDDDFFHAVLVEKKNEKGQIIHPERELQNSGKKKWELYTCQAQAAIEIFKTLNEGG